MKKYVFSLLFSFVITSLIAEDGHQLWLRNKTALPVNVATSIKSPIISNAVLELQNGWLGKAGANVTLSLVKDKSLKGDGFKLTATSVQANTESGILYGVFELLRRQQTGKPITPNEINNPSYDIRILIIGIIQMVLLKEVMQANLFFGVEIVPLL